MRLSITWPASANEEAVDILRNVVGLPAGFAATAEVDDSEVTLIVDLDDGELDALEPYWCNPFVWSPLEPEA